MQTSTDKPIATDNGTPKGGKHIANSVADNQRLHKENERLRKENERLRKENERLSQIVRELNDVLRNVVVADEETVCTG